jgi:cell division protein FtsB
MKREIFASVLALERALRHTSPPVWRGSGQCSRMVRLRGLAQREEEVFAMRILTLALAAALACAASPAPGQDLAPVQPQVQELPKDQDRPPAPTQDKTQGQPTSQELPKSPDRIGDRSQPDGTSVLTKAPSRYTFNRINDNFLRLDHETGQVAYCSPHASGWACEAVPEERAALDMEIARLQDEVASLKAEIAALRTPPPPPRPPADLAPHDGKDDDAQIKLPTAEDLARARAFFEIAWRRLMEMIVNIQKDMLHKG